MNVKQRECDKLWYYYYINLESWIIILNSKNLLCRDRKLSFYDTSISFITKIVINRCHDPFICYSQASYKNKKL